MLELDSAAILQANATIITGILILLTLSQIKTRGEETKLVSLSRQVSYVVIPFVISAILIIYDSICRCFLEEKYLYIAGLFFMIIGFTHIAFVIVWFTQKRV